MNTETREPGLLIRRACPACGNPAARQVLQKGLLTLARCAACGMHFSSRVDPRLIDGRFYDEQGAYQTSASKLAGDFSPVRFRRELALFRRHCRSGTVLDVGCSTGAFLDRLQSAHPGVYEGYGMDVSEPALAHARSLGLNVATGCFDTHDFVDRRFDAITFWAVLEHVANPGNFLGRAAELLLPGGHCFALVPNWKSLAIRLLGGRYRYVMPEHLNYFTRRHLCDLAERQAGWRVIEARTLHFNPWVLAQDFFRPRASVAPEQRSRLLNRTNALQSRRSLKPLRLVYQAVEAVLSRLDLADNLVVVLQKDGHVAARD